MQQRATSTSRPEVAVPGIPPWWIAAPIQVGLSFAVAGASFALVERRFLRRKAAWAPGSRPDAAPTRVAPA